MLALEIGRAGEDVRLGKENDADLRWPPERAVSLGALERLERLDFWQQPAELGIGVAKRRQRFIRRRSGGPGSTSTMPASRSRTTIQFAMSRGT